MEPKEDLILFWDLCPQRGLRVHAGGWACPYICGGLPEAAGSGWVQHPLDFLCNKANGLIFFAKKKNLFRETKVEESI